MKSDLDIAANFDVKKIFANVYLLDIMRDYPKFKEFTNKTNEQDFFKGYLFLIKCVQRDILSCIGRSSYLDIDEDYTISRAFHQGIDLSKIENTCQKTIVLKNLHSLFRNCWKSSDEKELAVAFSELNKEFIHPIQKIFETSVGLTQKFQNYSKEELVKILAIFYTYIDCNDTSHGFPKAYLCSVLKTNLYPKYLNEVFEGYKIALQYLWKKMLNENYSDSKLKGINQAKNWYDLDSFFNIIRTEVIYPLEKKLKCNIAFDPFFEVKEFAFKDLFLDLAKKEPKTINVSLTEKLGQIFWWYPIDVLAESGSYVFNGVNAFIRTLIGSIEFKKMMKIEEKTIIVRIKQPQVDIKDKPANNYSYAILVEAFGTIADYSGWLLFFNCCTDYSGFGGSEHDHAEMIIEKYLNQQRIEIKEITVMEKKFNIFLKKHGVKGSNLSLALVINELKNNFSCARGYLLEFLAYWYFTSQNQMTRWRLANKKIGDIDVISMDQNATLNIITCMPSIKFEKIKKLETYVSEILKDKAILPEELKKFENIRKIVFTVIEPSKKHKMNLPKDVLFLSLERLFAEDPLFFRIKKGALRKILQLDQKTIDPDFFDDSTQF